MFPGEFAYLDAEEVVEICGECYRKGKSALAELKETLTRREVVLSSLSCNNFHDRRIYEDEIKTLKKQIEEAEHE
jgi:hypothetical protein